VKFAASLGIVAGTLLVVVYGFVSVTSVVGQPFFEKLSHRVDDRMGEVTPGPDWPWWRNAMRGVGEGLRIALVTVPMSLAVVLLGVVPVVGTVLGWTAGALIGGWFIALEFCAIPFERRGLLLRDRRRVLGAHRARTLGFGSMAFVMSVFAPLAVIMMPSAVAGGTLLARWALDADVAAGEAPGAGYGSVEASESSPSSSDSTSP
jgi:CysZ protein